MKLSPATVIAALALVFAMTGGAYAAKKYLITSTKQISPSVLKQLQGKAGAAGVPGAAGAQGAQGPAGPAGTAGSAGGKGETGPAGAKGEKGSIGPTGSKGATGATGTTGFTETLPPEKTETGSWSYLFAGNIGAPVAITSISFPIPLRGASEGPAFVFDKAETENKEFGASGCAGTVAEPTAPVGVLCVYTDAEELSDVGGSLFAAMIPTQFEGYGPSGTFLAGLIASHSESKGAGGGTWAVTAPKAP